MQKERQNLQEGLKKARQNPTAELKKDGPTQENRREEQYKEYNTKSTQIEDQYITELTDSEEAAIAMQQRRLGMRRQKQEMGTKQKKQKNIPLSSPTNPGQGG